MKTRLSIGSCFVLINNNNEAVNYLLSSAEYFSVDPPGMGLLQTVCLLIFSQAN